MEGRVTLDTYREGLADMTNLLVLPQGGVTRRPGTEYLGEIKNSAQAARLIPFQFKTTDTYILEFGDQTMRVFRSGLQVLDAADKVITGITQANPGVITSNSHGFSDGDEIFVDAIVGMTELNGRNYRVDNATTNTFTLTDLFGNDIDTTGFTAYSSAGTATEIYNIATPYLAADLPGLRFVQSADTMYLVHPSYDIRKLTRTADNAWTFVIPIFQGPLLAAKTVEDITQANPGVVTVTGHGFSNGDQIQLNNIQGMVELEELNFRVANVTTNTFTLQDEAGNNINTTAFTAFVDGGGDSGTITGATTANPVVITSTSHPFFNGNIIYISGVSGMTELNGNYYKVSAATTNTFALQTVAGVNVDGNVLNTYTSGGTAEIGASKVQEIAPVSTALSGANDRPSVVSFFEQRLVFGNTNNNPQTL